jgi:hypothetical protein
VALVLSACGVSNTADHHVAALTASQTASAPVAVKTGDRQGSGTHHHLARKPHHPSQGSHHHATQHPVGVPSVDVPRPALTPGVALAVGTTQVCRSGYASSVRDVPDSLKAAVYARYGVAWVPYRHEVDHLISLELGGSNSIRNLWPEPYAGRWGARTKDVLENRLHDLVCAGSLSLAHAQHQEATDWVAAYRRYVGTPPGGGSGGSGSAGGTSPGGYYASRYPTASTIYCADDPEWRNLSPTYLVHFDTWAQAHARFPTYHLHRPC